MAEQQPRVFAPVAGRNDEGFMLDVGGGTTLPFTEEQLDKQGLMVDGERVVYKPDIVITGNLGEGDPEPAAPTGVEKEGVPTQLPTTPTEPAPAAEAPAPEVATPTAPQPEAPVEPQLEAPAEPQPVDTQMEEVGFTTDQGVQTAGISTGGAGFGDVNRIVDEAIQSTSEFLQGRTPEGAEGTVVPEEMVGEGRPLLLKECFCP